MPVFPGYAQRYKAIGEGKSWVATPPKGGNRGCPLALADRGVEDQPGEQPHPNRNLEPERRQ
jgi:hypothetical protein